MVATTSSLPGEITGYLRAYVQRRRWVALARSIGTAIVFSTLWLLCWSIVDRIAQLPAAARWGILVINVMGIVALLVRPIARLCFTSIDWQTAAEQVESLEPAFQQKLATVVSQNLLPKSQQGSEWLVEQLTSEVQSLAAGHNGSRIVSAAPAVRAWFAAGLSVLIIVMLLLWPWLSLRTLLGRLAMPWRDIPSVTTTRLSVEPGDTRVVEQESLKIVAHVENLIGETVTVHPITDKSELAPLTMLPVGSGRFELDIPAIEHDLRYFVRAGDATSPTYDVRVLRRPVVTEFRIHYTYPACIPLPSMMITNTDGLIEAPAGSEAVVQIVTSQPLTGGTMHIDQQARPLQVTEDPKVLQANLSITKDQKYTLDLLSTDDVTGHGPDGTHIRAIADRPPVAELSLPSDLRVHPRDLVPLQYLATDDYGLESLAIVARLNSNPPVTIALPVASGSRRSGNTHVLDLANLKLSAGDVLQLSLQAIDQAKQRTTSASRQVLIVPRTLDLNWQLRLQELLAALETAGTVHKDLSAAQKALQEANSIPDKASQAYMNAATRMRRDASAAVEGQARLKQSLLRSIARSSSPEFSISMAWLADRGQLSETLSQNALASQDSKATAAVIEAGQLANEVREGLSVLVAGERAMGLLADRMSIQALQRNSPANDDAAKTRIAAAIKRGQEDLARDARELGLDASAGDFENRLRSMANRAQDWMQPRGRMDFPAAAREWAAGQRAGLGARLATAAQAEAVRPDSQLTWARDLQLSARAAERLEQQTAAPQEVRKEYPTAFAAIHRENELLRQPTPDPNQLAEAKPAAEQARLKMRQWAGHASNPDDARLAAAMEANAQMARREFDKARQADRQLQPTTAPTSRNESIEQAMKQAEQIDKAAVHQAQLSKETAKATPQQSADLAQRQQQLANEVSKASPDADSSEPQANEAPSDADEQTTIRDVQRQLTAMGPQLRQVRNRSEEERKARARAEAARALGQSPAMGMKAAAAQAAAAEAENAERAGQQRAEASKKVSPAIAEEMSSRLARWLPQTSDALSGVEQQLSPSLRTLQQAVENRDAPARDRALSDTSAAIASVQKALTKLQEQAIERDPLNAAREFAAQAQEALQANPPDMQAAQQDQQKASAALGKAWDQSVQRAARLRLGGVPSMLSIFAPWPITSDAGIAARGAAAAPSAAGSPIDPRWARLRAKEEQELSAPAPVSDPPGYEEALKAYFEALGKSK